MMLLFPKRIRTIVEIAFGNKHKADYFLYLIERYSGLDVEDEGMLVVPKANKINFTGNVNVTDLNGVPQIQILGGGGGGGITGVISSLYGSQTLVGSEVPTLIVQVTADADEFLQRISCSSENLTDFTVQVNGATIDFRRSSYSTFGNVDFDFTGYPGLGRPLTSGDVISVLGTQYGISTCNMNARIQTCTQTS